MGYSLVKILQNDPDFSGALTRKKEAVKEDKQRLLIAANEYTKKYKSEIVEGDKLRHRLLEEGKSKGLTETEIFAGNSKFLPTLSTPILNFLYFMLRDEECQETKTVQEVIQECLKQYGYEKTEEVEKYINGIVQNFYAEQKLDEMGDSVSFEDVVSKETTKDVDDIGEFLYGNLTIKEFNTVKKLKALSQSSDEKEAFLAYRKCLQLCKKYHLEFDKIPCSVKRIK